ncbi:MAG TPA: hypothetical protein VHX38_32120 [Pseudonocardiaceae bacterium]|nr:hypothetical protein [Pseudonocardiaceae bacterium]
MDRAVPPGRTVCHGCRAQTHELIGEDGTQRYRPVILPGDGSIMREISPGAMVSAPCPICGDGEDPGWVEGFIVPV